MPFIEPGKVRSEVEATYSEPDENGVQDFTSRLRYLSEHFPDVIAAGLWPSLDQFNKQELQGFLFIVKGAVSSATKAVTDGTGEDYLQPISSDEDSSSLPKTRYTTEDEMLPNLSVLHAMIKFSHHLAYWIANYDDMHKPFDLKSWLPKLIDQLGDLLDD